MLEKLFKVTKITFIAVTLPLCIFFIFLVINLLGFSCTFCRCDTKSQKLTCLRFTLLINDQNEWKISFPDFKKVFPVLAPLLIHGMNYNLISYIYFVFVCKLLMFHCKERTDSHPPVCLQLHYKHSENKGPQVGSFIV